MLLGLKPAQYHQACLPDASTSVQQKTMSGGSQTIATMLGKKLAHKGTPQDAESPQAMHITMHASLCTSLECSLLLRKPPVAVVWEFLLGVEHCSGCGSAAESPCRKALPGLVRAGSEEEVGTRWADSWSVESACWLDSSSRCAGSGGAAPGNDRLRLGLFLILQVSGVSIEAASPWQTTAAISLDPSSLGGRGTRQDVQLDNRKGNLAVSGIDPSSSRSAAGKAPVGLPVGIKGQLSAPTSLVQTFEVGAFTPSFENG